MIIYAICTTSRSGSTWLCQLLESTMRLGEPDEYLNTDTAETEWREKLSLEAASDIAYIDKLTKNIVGDREPFGFKVTLTQLKRLEAAIGLPVQLIRLQRIDIARQAVSLYRAEASGKWFESVDDVPFDADKINECVRRLSRAADRWATFFQTRPHLPVWYEDIEADPLGQVKRIGAYLGVNLVLVDEVTATTRKLRDQTTEDWVKKLGVS